MILNSFTFSDEFSITPAIVSVFADRVADTQRDAVELMKNCRVVIRSSNQELLWASTREVDNIRQAELAGADIITATPDILKKMKLKGKDLEEYSIETVRMFFNDAKEAGFSL